MNRSQEEIQQILSTLRAPGREEYPELREYSRDAISGELIRYEHEKNIDPFDVQICLDQIEWGRTHEPRKTLFVLTARKK